MGSRFERLPKFGDSFRKQISQVIGNCQALMNQRILGLFVKNVLVLTASFGIVVGLLRLLGSRQVLGHFNVQRSGSAKRRP